MNPSQDSQNQPRAELLSETEARARILDRTDPLPTESVPLIQALDRFSSSVLFATQPLPAFDNSSMDGYALAISDVTDRLHPGADFIVTGEQPAGPDRGLRVDPGQAVRIFTGASVPANTGAVVMQEDIDRTGDRIVVRSPVKPGENIRRAGADLARGQKLFDRGVPFTPPRLALLASQGLAEISVCRRPRVAVLATGDELRPAGQPLGPGEIYESNSVLLATLAQGLGAVVTVLERARDDRDDLDAKLARGLDDQDALVVAGGVSVGEYDLVKDRLISAGTSLDLWRVRVQPGKPFLYGRHLRPDGTAGAHVFGLPGNPVSAFVTFLLFVRPALLKLMGAADDQLALPAFPARAAIDLVNPGKRPHYLRGVLDPRGVFAPVGRQESHALFALSQSSALARIDPETMVAAGETLTAFRWKS